MPILGVVASSISGNLYSASYESIATFSAGGSASVTFTSIPQTYTHLQLRITGREAVVGSTYSYLKLRMNGLGTAIYNFHAIYGTGSAVTSFGYASQTYIEGNYLAADSATANVQGAIIMDFLDYTNTNKFKTVRSMGGYDNNGDGRIALSSGSFADTAAISQILVATPGGELYNSGTTIALYGIKGA